MSDLHHIDDSNFMSKWGMNFPIGEGTFVTVNEGENQPIIRISYYEHSQKPNGDFLIIPKHLGIKLSLKQFSRLINNGSLMCQAIKTMTEQKQRMKKSVRLSKFKPKRVRKVRKVRKPKNIETSVLKPDQSNDIDENNKLVVDV